MELDASPKVDRPGLCPAGRDAEAMGEAKPLRVAVDGGGCSGFQYSITLDQALADDLVLEKDGQKVLVDAVSLPFLSNAVIDFTDELIGARFVVETRTRRPVAAAAPAFRSDFPAFSSRLTGQSIPLG